MQISDNLGFTPQVLIAWNDETKVNSAFDKDYGLDASDFGSGIGSEFVDPALEVDKYLGTEIEGTLSWTLHPGVNLDFIGSLVLAGDGLTEMLVAQGATDPDDTIWAFQSRLMVYIDQFVK